MYKACGVDYGRHFEYQTFGPALWTAIAKARAVGDIPEAVVFKRAQQGPDSITVDAGGNSAH
jgi:hypothetical protein